MIPSLIQFFNQFYDMLNARENHAVIISAFTCLFLFSALLRIAACSSYRSAMLKFTLDAKEIKHHDDIKKIKNGTLRKIAAEYRRVAEKSASRIPTSALVARQIDSFSLLGWRYASIIPFVETFEIGLTLVGVIFTLSFGEYAFMYGTIAAAGFVLTRLVSGLFDAKAARARFADELLIYIEREIGRFYASDSGGAVLRLKDELTGAINRQTETLSETIGQIGVRMAEAFGETLGGIDGKLKSAFEEWNLALGEAGRAQEALNASAENVKSANEALQTTSGDFAKYLRGHSNALTENLSALVQIIDSIREFGGRMLTAQETLSGQARYIEQNQTHLETTVQSFEATLQNMTRSLGDGYGALLKLHAQSAAQSVSDTLSANAERIAVQSREMIQTTQSLFEQLRNQSKEMTANLFSLNEQISELTRRHSSGVNADGTGIR